MCDIGIELAAALAESEALPAAFTPGDDDYEGPVPVTAFMREDDDAETE